MIRGALNGTAQCYPGAVHTQRVIPARSPAGNMGCTAKAPASGAMGDGVTTEVNPGFVDCRTIAGPIPGREGDRRRTVDQVVAEVVGQLQRRGGGPVDTVRIRGLVVAEWARYDGSRVQTFIPVLVGRAVVGRELAAGQV